METLQIYTDGSCSGHPGPGGWGAVLIKGNKRKELRGGTKHTTNNRMELTAAIRALNSLKRSYKSISVYTDSQYVKNGITKWIKDWKKKGWKTANRNAIKNIDLWFQLDELCSKHKINWIWVKGHSDHIENERADTLARLGMQRFIYH